VEVKRLLREKQINPKKRLGQNFLVNSLVYNNIIQAAKLNEDDWVLEIGAGFGFLTKLLAQRVFKVVTIEIDKEIVKIIKKQLEGFKNIEIIEGDILKLDLRLIIPKGQRIKVVANLPYYITTPIIFKLLQDKEFISCLTIMVQKEVGERIVAKPGSKDYGILSIMIQYHALVKKGMLVKNSCFFPSPKVDSVIINLEMLDKPRVFVNNETFFYNSVKGLFGQRRKMVINNLKQFKVLNNYDHDFIVRLLSGLNINPKLRPEKLSLEEIANLSNALSSLSTSSS